MIMKCRGLDDNGQSSVPVKSSYNVYHLSAGQKHTCFLSTTNSVDKLYCIGRISTLALDDPNISAINPRLLGLNSVLKGRKERPDYLTSGLNHTCTYTNADQVYCWGLNNYGQTGMELANNKTKKDKGTWGVYAGWDETCEINS
mmetsp:Transcript_65449/g.55533  ORF Transcript_65449/g.55533 Transcript_65449/m.55533 type:complete len:144 (-) Transcript_65449:163-594(-)